VTADPGSRRERHRARETALQLLYQWEVGRIGPDAREAALEIYWAVHPAPEPRRARALGLAGGAADALDTIDPLIARHTDNWRPERLAVVDRLIMRLAVYEMLTEETPAAVVINEALELAKTFSGERSVAFINGVLDAVRRAIAKPDPGRALGTPDETKPLGGVT
jgi:N utilization substance protein B